MTKRPRDLALTVPGETDYLYLIRDFITAISRMMGFPDHCVDEIEIAVDEVCANIIEHAYNSTAVPGRVIVAEHGGGNTPSIVLRVSAYSDRLEIRIQDQGPQFAIEKFRDLDLGEFLQNDRKRGMGIYIISNFMDEVRHTYHPDQGNELSLVKYLTGS